MKITKKQKIQLKEGFKTLNQNILFKNIESNFIPRKGDYLSDSFYYDTPFTLDEYEVKKVIFDYDINECFIILEDIRIDIEEVENKTYEELISDFESFGWKL